MERTISSCQLCVFFLTAFLSGDIVKAEFLINCVRASIIDALSVAVVLLRRGPLGDSTSPHSNKSELLLFLSSTVHTP